MSFVEIPLAEYINTEEEILSLYVHTVDKRILAFKDVVSNMTYYHDHLSFSHVLWDKVFDVVVLKEDFSHIEYTVERRMTSQEEIDEINSFLDEEIERFKPKPFVDTIMDEYENLVEDLI
jgi:hypothetical protein